MARRVVDKMLELVKEISLTLFKFSEPACVSGKCPEGSLSCGKIKEKREIYLKG